MAQGTIKKLISDKGFGFIKGDNGEFFFHRSAVEEVDFNDLQCGQAVEFEEAEGPKGPCAEHVRPA